MEKNVDLYYKYYKDQRRKLGFEKYDHERSYIKSALARKPNLAPEVDGNYLNGLIPKKKLIKEDILDVLEEKCVYLMKIRAAEGKLSCKFPIPEIIPGFPHIIPKKIINPLVERLKKREKINVSVKEVDNIYFIEIKWN